MAAASGSAMVSSPPTRGWSDVPLETVVHDGVVPAYAGVVPHISSVTESLHSRPRLRGGGPRSRPWPRPSRRSSPPTRGWSRWVCVVIDGLLVVPAYAGVVRPLGQAHPAGDSHSRPRLRGGGPADLRGTSSPPARSGPCRSAARSRHVTFGPWCPPGSGCAPPQAGPAAVHGSCHR